MYYPSDTQLVNMNLLEGNYMQQYSIPSNLPQYKPTVVTTEPVPPEPANADPNTVFNGIKQDVKQFVNDATAQYNKSKVFKYSVLVVGGIAALLVIKKLLS